MSKNRARLLRLVKIVFIWSGILLLFSVDWRIPVGIAIYYLGDQI